jgi:hypothetical protein
LSVTLRLAERLPLASGVKVTLIVQWLLAGTLFPQLFVCAKSPALAPRIEIWLIETGELSTLVKVIGTGELFFPTG